MPDAPEEFTEHCKALARLIDRAVKDPAERAEVFRMIETLVNTREWDGLRMWFVNRDDFDLEGLF